MRIALVGVVLVLAGCGGSAATSESPNAASLYSADRVVECLRDDEGLLVPEDEVIHVRRGFSVDDPEPNMSLRVDEEAEPQIRGDFTMVSWYGDKEELSKVQLFFAPTEEAAVQLREERVRNDLSGGASEADLSRDLQRRRNLVLVWDLGSTGEMRDQIARCLES